MSSTTASPSWFVQILFGRYRSLGDIQWTHLAVLGVIGFVMLYFYLFFLRRKFSHYSKAIARLPRSSLDIRKREMGRRMYSLLISEMVRVDTLLDQGLKPQHNNSSLCGDSEWGKEGLDHVHFKTSIAKSYYVLEKTALSRRPGLRHRDSRTIREYVGALRNAFPSLKSSLCEEYINTYERAVFGNHKCTVDEYSQFMKVVLQIVGIINEKNYSQLADSSVAAHMMGSGGSGASYNNLIAGTGLTHGLRSTQRGLSLAS